MKKIATIMGLFGLMIVQAQVGINNDKPDATLDVAAGKTDGSQVEGLLVPRISKLAASTMATNPKLKESTLVYINNIADYTTTPVAFTVADITEKGYYFWNDSKWVKTAGKDGAEWVYDPVTKQTNLKRSGTAPFENKVYYNETGNKFNILGAGITEGLHPITRVVGTSNIRDTWASQNITIADISKMKRAPGLTSAPWGRTFANLRNDILYIDALPQGINSAQVLSSGIAVPPSNADNFSSLYGHSMHVTHSGAGSAERIISNYTKSEVSENASVSEYVTGSYNQVSLYSTKNVENVYTYNGLTADIRKGGTTNNVVLDRNFIYFQGTGSSVKNLYGNYTGFRVKTGHNLTLENSYGFHFNGFNNVNYGGTQYIIPNVKNSYGLYLNDVVGGTVSNYAIYTRKGKVRFGDQVEISNINANTSTNVADKVVVADATTGELKTKPATSLAGAEWVYDPVTKQTNLKRSGTAPFVNKVFYDESGKKFNLGIDTYPAYRSDTDTHFTVNPILSDRAKNINMTALSKIAPVSNPIIAHAQNFSSLNRDLLLVDELPQGLTGASLRRAHLYIPPSSTMTTMGELYGEMTSTEHDGNGTVKRIIGSYKSAGARGSAKVSEYIIGGFNQTSVRANATVKNVYTHNNVHSGRGRSTVAMDNFILSRNIGYFMKESSETIKNIHGNYTMLRAMTGSNLKVDNVFGLRFSGFNNTYVDNVIPEIKNYYGLFLNDVVGGTVSNYAIYTGKGKVRFGDDVGVGTTAKPQAKLDVNGYIKLGSADTTGDVAPKPGMLRYNTTTNKFQGYVGGTTNAWVDLH